MKCQNQCKRKATLILLLNNKELMVCSDCYINLSGLRADFDFFKKQKGKKANQLFGRGEISRHGTCVSCLACQTPTFFLIINGGFMDADLNGKKKIILTIIETNQQFKTVGEMMKRKEQLLKMGVRSKARITTP